MEILSKSVKMILIIKMKIDVALLQNLIEGSHLDKDNTYTKIWCFDNIDYRIEHVMHKCLDLYPQLFDG